MTFWQEPCPAMRIPLSVGWNLKSKLLQRIWEIVLITYYTTPLYATTNENEWCKHWALALLSMWDQIGHSCAQGFHRKCGARWRRHCTVLSLFKISHWIVALWYNSNSWEINSARVTQTGQKRIGKLRALKWLCSNAQLKLNLQMFFLPWHTENIFKWYDSR